MECEYPRVLVVANNGFSLSNSNGRTLGNFLVGWPKDRLAEFCLSISDPNFALCENYYCLSDSAILQAVKHLTKAKGRVICPSTNIAKQTVMTGTKGRSRNAFNACARQLLWNKCVWDSDSFRSWVNDFSPQLVLVYIGDTPFIHTIAETIAKRSEAPIVIFNTEGYCFFKKNWFKKGPFDWLFFYLYRKVLYRSTKAVVLQSKDIIHCNQQLCDDYAKEFGKVGKVLYTASSVKRSERSFNSNSPHFLYAGGVDLYRYKALIEISEVLQSINKDYYLDIYGTGSEEAITALKMAHGVRYHGIVSYEVIKEKIENSDVLFHAESYEGYKRFSLKYAFSTKIADSIASGKCFFVYAPPQLACSEYIRNTQAGWYASNKEDLRLKLTQLVTDDGARNRIQENAQRIAYANHNQEKSSQMFKAILLSK